MDPSWRSAADEHGILTVADLRNGGLDTRAVARLVRGGELTLLARGWFALGTPDTAEARHILATRAMLRSHGGRAVASYQSGLLFNELPAYQSDLETVRLSRVTAGPPRTRPGLRLGRVVPTQFVTGETVHTAVACVQVGCSVSPLAALIAADAALHAELVTPQDLRDALDWATRHPRVTMVEAFLEMADGRRESPGETRLAHAFHLMGQSVTPQFRVAEEGFVAIVDFLVDGHMVVVEFDGKVKYGRSPGVADPFGRKLRPEDVVWLEKRREDRLRELGYEVVRVVWSELDDPVGLAKRIRAAISRVRSQPAA